MLYIYNSLTRKKEKFVPLNNKKVTIYACGITPYDTTHLGHAFVYISFDILIRYLNFKGHNVIYTQNVTDINDRDKDILEKALEQNVTWQKLADFWTKRFLKDMKTLNWIMPTNYLYASKNLDSMTNLIQKLLIKGYAYEKKGSVYFDIAKKKDYGKLSRLTGKQMFEVAKDFDEDIDNKDKRNPLDITLWRGTKKDQAPHIPSFESPFGKGRPGWHIECSAMSSSTLGEQIDIHGGGVDLIYPHHEAEIAQSEGATGKIPFAKYWMHVGAVSYQGQKMSKSLGNLIMVSDLLKKYSSNAIRWYLISHRYRAPFEFKEKNMKASNKEFSQIIDFIKNKKSKIAINNDLYFNKFLKALEDDLNTPLALKIIKEIYQQKGSIVTLQKCLSLLGFRA